MPHSITVCLETGGNVEIYVNGELERHLTSGCWSSYIAPGCPVQVGDQITLKAIPEEGMYFQKYEVFYFEPLEIKTVTDNPWKFILPDREIAIYVYFTSTPPTRPVKVKVRVISVGTPPTSVSAEIDGKPVGETTVYTPGEYEIGKVELEPGTYIVKATAIDSVGKTALDEKQVEVG